VFLVFLKLGVTSFGGPIAHLGYFRDELVVRRNGSTSGVWRPGGAVPVPAGAGFQPGGVRAGVLRGKGLLAAGGVFAFTMPSR